MMLFILSRPDHLVVGIARSDDEGDVHLRVRVRLFIQNMTKWNKIAERVKWKKFSKT